MFKKAFICGAVCLSFLASCTTQKTISKNAVPFPGMTVSRTDYDLSKDVKADVEVKELKVLGFLSFAKAVGEEKNTTRQGVVMGFGLDKAGQIAAYRLLEKNPEFDYLTNIRVKKEFTSKWLFVVTKYTTNVEITAKGITLKTDK